MGPQVGNEEWQPLFSEPHSPHLPCGLQEMARAVAETHLDPFSLAGARDRDLAGT